jgi:hypothetical protein
VRLDRLAEAELGCVRRRSSRWARATSPTPWCRGSCESKGLIAAARGDRALAQRRLREAADRWRRYVPAGDEGDRYVATLADLGRPPVLGLVEPARELEALLAELESLTAVIG